MAKVKRISKPYARKIQILTVLEQRAKVAGKTQQAQIAKKGKDKYMSFNFDIVYTPDTELTKDNVKLQEFAGIMLEQIMARGIEEGNVLTREVKDESND